MSHRWTLSKDSRSRCMGVKDDRSNSSISATACSSHDGEPGGERGYKKVNNQQFKRGHMKGRGKKEGL